mgnify:CR=1 FL=1
MDTVKQYCQQPLGALIIYLALALLLTFPMCLHPIDTVVGHDHASVGCHVWVLWWARQSLDLHTPLIFFPYGADVVQLYGSDLLSPLLFSVIPFPPSLLYNLWVLFLLVIGAMGVRQLISFIQTEPWLPLAGGWIWMCSPFLQHEMLNGTSELLSTGLLSWFCWLTISIWDDPTPRKGIYIGFVAGVLLMSSAYNPFFMLLMLLVLLMHRLSTNLNPLWSKALLFSTMWAGLAFLPFLTFVGWIQLEHGALDTFSRRLDWLDLGVSLPDSYVSLMAWFDPTPSPLPAIMPLPDGTHFEYWTTCTNYIGWTLLVGMVVGWKHRKTYRFGGWAWMTIVAMLIAMGPYLRIDNNVLFWGTTPIHLPAQTINFLFPLFSITAIHAYRYSAVVCIAIAVLAVRGMRGWTPLWMGLCLLETILFAPQPYPQHTTTISQSPTLRRLRDLPDAGVFTFPIAKEDLHDLSTVLLAQTIHEKPIHEGGIHRRAGFEATQLFRDNYVVDSLSGRWGPEYPSTLEGKMGLQYLQQFGYDYVLVPSDNNEAISFAQESLGNPISGDDEWTLWQLSSITP